MAAIAPVYTWTPATPLGNLNAELEALVAAINGLDTIASALGTTYLKLDGSNDGNTVHLTLGDVVVTSLTVGGSAVWHAGNDGPASGLDADTLDGTQLADLLKMTTTRSANTVLAGPTSGSAAAPTFRALVNADLPPFTGWKVYRNTTQTLTNNVEADLQFNAELSDSDAYHDNSVNNTEVVIPTGKDGTYLIGGVVEFATNTAGNRAVYLRRNDVTVGNFLAEPAGGTAPTRFVYLQLMTGLVAGDVLTVAALQDSGGNLNITGGSLNAFWGIRLASSF